MAPLMSLLASVAVMAGVVSAVDPDLGPAAFLWPNDRVFNAALDTTAPCGSVSTVGNRTEFPLTNGKIAIVAQDESYDMQVSISYLSDPQSNTDFSTIITGSTLREIDLGHTCVSVPDAPSSVTAGSNATLQMMFISTFDTSANGTYYACADITYVPLSSFDISIPCFNATEPAPTATPSPSKGSKSSGLSSGAIAGIVIGVVAAIASIAGAVLVVYRRKQQRLSMLRQQHSSRGVKWDEQPGRASASTSSVRMQNM